MYVQWEVKNTLLVSETIQGYKIQTRLVDMRTKIPRVLDLTSDFYFFANVSDSMSWM